MRISDWSSDVCSSDLRAGDAVRNRLAVVVGEEHAVGLEQAMDLRVGSRIEHLEAEDLDAAGGGASAAADATEGKHEGQHEAAPGSVVDTGEAAAGPYGAVVEGSVQQGIEQTQAPAIEKTQPPHPDRT